jgi:hypothetical protein
MEHFKEHNKNIPMSGETIGHINAACYNQAFNEKASFPNKTLVFLQENTLNGSW